MRKPEYTVHVGYGLCKIIGTVTRYQDGKAQQYIKLQDAEHKDTFIYVPENQMDDRTRTFTEPEIIHNHLEGMKSTPYIKDNSAQNRWKRITKLLESPELQDRFHLLVLIHDGMKVRKTNGKKMVGREQIVYNKVLHLLCLEVSLSLQIEQEVATKLIQSKLKSRAPIVNH